MRDGEDRVRFSGYSVSNLKTFIFCVAAAMSALGGAMFSINVGFMSPKLVTIEPSIYMVIFCAVGGALFAARSDLRHDPRQLTARPTSRKCSRTSGTS